MWLVKRCARCKVTQPASSFPLKKATTPTRPETFCIRPGSYCRPCLKIRNKSFYDTRLKASLRPKIKLTEKLCHKCGTTKAVSDFLVKTYRVHTTGEHRETLSSRCKICLSAHQNEYFRRRYKLAKATIKARQKERAIENPEKAAEQARNKKDYFRGYEFNRYGLTVEDFDKLNESQGGKCAICKQVPRVRRLHIDHCHKTGRVRGLLCHKCNIALGLIYERLENALNLAEYIRLRCN